MAASTGFEFGSFLFEHRYKFRANDFAFGLGVSHTRQLTQKQITCVHTNDFGVKLALKHFHHRVAFVQAQQTMVDKHTAELVAYGAVYERSCNGRIHTTRQT